MPKSRLAAIAIGALLVGSACSDASVVVLEKPVLEVSTLAQAKKLDEVGYQAVVSPGASAALPPLVDASVPVPVSVSIDAISVSGAPVDPVGVTPSGEMEIPEASRVGWYSFGPSPGQNGSAVMAAHIASDGINGVFAYLDRLEQGDQITIVYDDGSLNTYLVSAKEQYGKDQLPFDQIFARDGSPRLVLITCGGDFNSSIRSYADNFVVYAEPI